MPDQKKPVAAFLQGIKQGMESATKGAVVVRRVKNGYLFHPLGEQLQEARVFPDWDSFVEELRLFLHPEHARGN